MKRALSDRFWIYLNGICLALSLLMVFGILLLIVLKGLVVFWPKNVEQIDYRVQTGQLVSFFGEKIHLNEKKDRYLYRTGARELNDSDFMWLDVSKIEQIKRRDDIAVVQRYEWGNIYGIIENFKKNNQLVSLKKDQDFQKILNQYLEEAKSIHQQILQIKKNHIESINYKLRQLNLKEKKLVYENVPQTDSQWKTIASEKKELRKYLFHYDKLKNTLFNKLKSYEVQLRVQDRVKNISFDNIEKIYWPNQMNWLEKIGFYFSHFYHFVVDEPREANTEGGIFPAIFGTVALVMLMSIFVTPFGIMVAFYLNEYAKDNYFTRLIRVSINNMAGVPAIVYGIFGLSFFIYTVGGSIDTFFYPERLPSPTWGTPGLLWASLTLALLTLPVVVVATEEGLMRIPQSIREASFALGTSRFEMLKVIAPMVIPSMITGLILAIARAAGEVAPLMLVGAVKIAPAYVLDSNFPFFHFERKFMHIGFHIYDLGFQSPNIEITKPLVFVTALLLIAIVLSLNIFSIILRSNLRNKYRI